MMIILGIIQTLTAAIGAFIGGYVATGIWLGGIKNPRIIKKSLTLAIAFLLISFILLMITK